MLDASRQQVLARLDDRDVVLDVGGWAKPFGRADWVLDLLPYETRGLYGDPPDPARERFSADTWVTRDICDHEPWPFVDNQFDFAVCSHTLEDIRDPVWVCHELQRVARAGYVEVPSRLEEQAYGIDGPWAGWDHHRWLVDTADDHVLRFVFKARLLETDRASQFSPEFGRRLTDDQRVTTVWWKDRLVAREEIFVTREDALAHLRAPVAAHEPGGWPARSLARRVRDRLR